MTDGEKKEILDRMLKNGQLDPADFNTLESDLDLKLDKIIDDRKMRLHELFLQIQYAKMGVIS